MMDADFWHDKWDNNQIGFHQADGNSLLMKHFPDLALQPGARVFVPLCGKTRDIAWLLAQGCRVVGAELSERAVQQLFAEMDVVPDATEVGRLIRYTAEGIDVFVGDIFDLDKAVLGPVDAVFDRAALVALPQDMRAWYGDHMVAITGAARQLVVTFVYDQTQMSGPPFSISEAEIKARYAAVYDIQPLETCDVLGGFKGQVPAVETVWMLKGQ